MLFVDGDKEINLSEGLAQSKRKKKIRDTLPYIFTCHLSPFSKFVGYLLIIAQDRWRRWGSEEVKDRQGGEVEWLTMI